MNPEEFAEALGADVVIPVGKINDPLEMLALIDWWNRRVRGPKRMYHCVGCGDPAEWVRYTQFAGDHPFCQECAEKEPDFMELDDSYFHWRQIGE